MSRETQGVYDFVGIIDIDKTIPLWNYNLEIKENLRNGNVIWCYEPEDPWYKEGFIQE